MSAIVQSFWFGGEFSPLHALGLRSFIANGHEFHLYVYEDVSGVPERVVLKDAAEIAPRESAFAYRRGFGRGSYSAFSNLFRYLLLHERGGWWSDTDVVCLRPFDFDGEYVFATEHDAEGRTTTASCVIRAPAGAEVLKYCIDECGRKDVENLEWGEIGPRLLHDATGRFGLERYRVEPNVFNPIDYTRVEEFNDPSFDVSRLDGASAVHLWHQKWVECDMDPGYASPGSLHDRLRTRYGMKPRTVEDHVRFLDGRVAALRAQRAELEWKLDQARAEIESSWNQLATLKRDRDSLTLERDAALNDAARLRTEADAAHAEVAKLGEEIASLREEVAATRNALATSETTLADHRAASARRQAELESQLADVAWRLERIQATYSWRWTAPARALLDRIADLSRTLGLGSRSVE